MPTVRVVGIDPGTISLDLCGLEDGRVFLDATWPTADAISHPEALIAAMLGAGPVDLVVGPSGYGLPVVPAADVSDDDLRLAFLARPGEPGGIGGVGRLARRLGEAGLPVVFIPGVVHFDTVPRHRKVNRVDMGTADKVSAAALAIHQQAERRGVGYDEVSLVLVELGGAFTAGLAIEGGRLVDGIGGTSGPLGWRSAGGWDGEVAYLAGEVSKAALFQGGVETMVTRDPALRDAALLAYIEGIGKLVAQLLRSASGACEVVVSGRMAGEADIGPRILRDLGVGLPLRLLQGFAAVAKQGAQGAALLADGLAGGRHRGLVERLRVREAAGTVLDYLYVLPPDAARRRLRLGPRA